MGLSDRLQQHRNQGGRAPQNPLEVRRQSLCGGFTVRDWVAPRINHNGQRELHAPLANYVGPRTDIVRRLKEGIKPTTHTDAGAKKHDIQYYNIGVKLAKGQLTRPQAIAAVKASDNQLLKTALYNKLAINPVEHMHANTVLAGIGGKKILQGVGAMDELKFVDPNDGEILEGGRRRGGRKPNLVKGLKKRFSQKKKK